MNGAELISAAEEAAGAAHIDAFKEGQLDDHGVRASYVEDDTWAGKLYDVGDVGGGGNVGGVIGDLTLILALYSPGYNKAAENLTLILAQYSLGYHKADRVYYITALVVLSHFSLISTQSFVRFDTHS